MKSILRKKGPTDNRQGPSPPPVQHERQPSTIETPLYARFATVKSGLPPQERVRPVVSGPMPLGRPSRANHEAEENRRRHEEIDLLRHRTSDARQGTPPTTQSASRGVQSPADRPHQVVRVSPAPASRQPIKAQMACKSCYSFAPMRRHAPLCWHALRSTALLGSRACKAFEQGCDFVPSRSHCRSP
jgi:ribosomal protein S14